MPAREAWGLDIGQTALHAIKIRRTKGQDAEIADLFFYDLKTELDDPEYNNKVFAGLEEFVDRKKVGNTPVVVSLPGFSTLFREVNLAAASISNLDVIVGYEAKQLIPYPLEEVIYDYHKFRFDPETGEITIALICCRRDIIERTLNSLDNVGLNVDCLQVGPVALFNYFMYEYEPEDAVLILDTGARGTDFIVINDESFWLRSIGISGADLSKALMNKFSIPFDRAESLKYEMGESKQADRVFRVLSPVLNNLCGEVQRSVGYYKSLFRGVNIDKVYCVGNTYLLAGVDQFVADNLRMETYTCNVPETLDLHFSVDAAELEDNRQVMCTAAGLALQGVGLASVDTTLLPRERIVKKTIARKLSWAFAAVGLIFLAVMVNLLFAGGQAEKFEDIKTTAQKISLQAAKAKKAYKAITDQYPAEEARSRALAQVSKTRGFVIQTMGALMASLEKWNARQNNLDIGKLLMQKEKKELYNKYYLEFNLSKDDEDLDKLKQSLKEKIERRLKWKYNRLHKIFFSRVNCQVVKYRKKIDLKNPKQVEWLGLTTELEKRDLNERNTRRRAKKKKKKADDFRIIDEPVVKVEIEWFMVFTPKRTTNDRAKATIFKDAIKKLDGVIEKTFEYKSKTDASAVNAIQLPVITDPHPQAESAAPDGGGRVQPGQELKFELFKEPVGQFNCHFIYVPKP